MNFVDFDLAKKLKEKGYPQIKRNTLAMYSEYGEWFSLTQTIDDFEYSFVDFDEHDCVCPTISQVLKWFRDDKKMHVVCPFYKDKGFYYYIQRIGNAARIVSSFGDSDDCFEDYEQAALTGIEYVLDNLI